MNFIYFLCVNVLPVCMYVYMCITCDPDDHRGQKRTSDPLELELLAVLRHDIGAEPGSSGTAIFPSPHTMFLIDPWNH